MSKFWNWNSDSGERVLEIRGTIADESWFDDDVTPAMFRDELLSGTGPVTVWICSPGGDCIAASQIYTMLMNYKGPVTIKIDGIAASAASVIAMAGTTVLMSPTSLVMVHNPSTLAFGDHSEMEKAIEMLDEVKESIINAYQLKTGLSRKKISELMEQETWMNARKAIELGFADGMLKGSTDEKEPEELEPEGPEESLPDDRCKKKSKNESPVQEGFLFSAKAVNSELVRKMMAKAAVDTPAENTVDTAAEVTVDTPTETTVNISTGTPITDLEKRLNLLK